MKLEAKMTITFDNGSELKLSSDEAEELYRVLKSHFNRNPDFYKPEPVKMDSVYKAGRWEKVEKELQELPK